MSLTSDLDAWIAGISAATGIPATRDPGKVFPPCLYMGPPTVAKATLTGMRLTVEVWVVDETPDAANVDKTLNSLRSVMLAMNGNNAEPLPLDIGGQVHSGYRITGEITITEE